MILAIRFVLEAKEKLEAQALPLEIFMYLLEFSHIICFIEKEMI